MKKWIMVLALSAGALLFAEEKILIDESFEQQVPGEAPKGWRRLWGKDDDAFFSVVNERAATGKNSIAIELNEKNGNGGYFWNLPEIKKGTIVFQFKFLYDQAGANLWFELRDKIGNTVRLVSFGFRDSRLNFHTNKKNAVKKGGRIPGLEKDTWYNLKLEISASPADGGTVKLELTNLSTKNTSVLEADYAFPKKFAMLVPCLNKAKSPFKVFLDDIKVSVRE